MRMIGQREADWRKPIGRRPLLWLLTRTSILMVVNPLRIHNIVQHKVNIGGIRRNIAILMIINGVVYVGLGRNSRSIIIVLIVNGFLRWLENAKETVMSNYVCVWSFRPSFKWSLYVRLFMITKSCIIWFHLIKMVKTKLHEVKMINNRSFANKPSLSFWCTILWTIIQCNISLT